MYIYMCVCVCLKFTHKNAKLLWVLMQGVRNNLYEFPNDEKCLEYMSPVLSPPLPLKPKCTYVAQKHFNYGFL